MIGHDARSFRFCFVVYSFIVAEVLMFVNTFLYISMKKSMLQLEHLQHHLAWAFL